MAKILIISFLFFQASFFNTPKTVLNFDIILNNKVVGSLESTRMKKDGLTHYQSSTNIETRLIKDILVNYKYDVIFNSKILKMAAVHITINKKPHAETLTQWTGTHYQVSKDDYGVKTLKDAITFSTIQLYFKEPVNIKSCYSEQDGSFNTIVPMGNHSYKKINSKGKENIYYYKHGILKKVTIDGGLISFEMIAREP
ncbi:MAG: DUF6134 family protein [Mesonia hippocampi]|uniref:DUF6134 family protein n=1 Tax=Mesonia hippocampi TaxID=1628250 RepID=UPI003F98733A